MKKTIIILGVALLTLSATLAFKAKSEITTAPAVKEEKVASTNGGGFALQDQDQWK
ncbi:MAG: hypothetical protein RI909_1847 [Bacteroidota bacterium]|jgi:hypothetical protein